MKEMEVKFLNIDVAKTERILRDIGAEKRGEYFYRRYIFDFPGFTLDKQGAWLRLRDEGGRITLGYKQRLGRVTNDTSMSDDGMKEYEVEVSDFETTAKMLLAVGMIEKFYQENKRTRWENESILFDIDIWPKIEPYLEIEAGTQAFVDEGVRLLGLDAANGYVGSNFEMYMEKGIDIREYQRMTFDEFVKRK